MCYVIKIKTNLPSVSISLQVHLCSFEVYLLTCSPIVTIGLFSHHSNLWVFSQKFTLMALCGIESFVFGLLIIMLLKCFFVVLCISTSFSFYCWMAFHCTKIPWAVYWLSDWWKLNCFQLWAITGKSTMTNHIYMFVWIYMFISLVNTLEWNYQNCFSKVTASSGMPTYNSNMSQSDSPTPSLHRGTLHTGIVSLFHFSHSSRFV